MIVYNMTMRCKDINKSKAIFHATIQLLNEFGFSDTSMSKIAKKANLSPSTIYVYFENKEDMLNKLYLYAKAEMGKQLFADDNEEKPIKRRFESILKNYISFALTNEEEFLFIEQFKNSPYIKRLSIAQGSLHFKPLYGLFETGKQQELVKKVDTDILITYSFSPIAQILKLHLKGEYNFEQTMAETLIEFSWDAIKAK